MYTNAFHKAIAFVYDLLDDDLKAAIEVVGEFFDDIRTDCDFVLSQIDIYQLTTSGLLVETELFYGLPSTGTLTYRRQRIAAAKRSIRGYSKAHFESVAKALGYTIGTSGTKYLTFIEGTYGSFRVGISLVGIDKIYNPANNSTSTYTVIISGTNVETDTDLQLLFDKMRMPGITLIYSDV